MYRFFKCERNEPCPCGSGKKYKKCCRAQVEESMSAFDDDWKRIFPGLAEALGMVCGLDEGEDETIPHPERINKGVEQLVEVLQNEDKDEIVFELMRRAKTLTDLFKEEETLMNNLFSYEQVKDLMIEMETALSGNEEEPDFESLFEELSDEYLPHMVDKQRAEEMAWSFFDLLREREWDDWSLECLSTGLMFSLDESVLANPLWKLVLRVSLEKNAQAVAELEELQEKLENGEEDAMQLLEDYLEKNPIMKGYWSRKVWADAKPALRALETGELDLKMPLHSVLGSLVCMVDYAGKLKEKEFKGDSLEQIINMLLHQKTEYTIELLEHLINKGMVLDLNIFMDHMNEVLQSWLKEEEVPEELKTSVATLLIDVNMGVVTAQLHILENIYITNFLNTAENIPVTLPAYKDAPALTLDWQVLHSREGLENYAAYLEKAGEQDAGSHVRKVIAEVITGD